MKLAILSRAPKIYSTQRFVAAAHHRGHEVRVLNTLRCAIDLSRSEPEMQYRGKPLDDFDAVIPRIGASITYFGTAVVRQMEQMDIYTPNTATGIVNARDKLRALQILSRHDIGIPATTFVRDRADVLPAIERVGGAPVIIKLLEGTQGMGVVLAETDASAKSVIEAFSAANVNIMVQEFIRESEASDVRAFVVGGRVVAAIMRIGQAGEFRSNLHRGGRAQAISITGEEGVVAVRAAAALGLNVCGVDMLRTRRGPMVMEVNSSPGLEGVESSTGVNVAREIINFLENNAPHGDTVTRGHG